MIKLLIVLITSCVIGHNTDDVQGVSFREPVVQIMTADISTRTAYTVVLLDTVPRVDILDHTFNSQPELNWILKEEVCSGKRGEA